MQLAARPATAPGGHRSGPALSGVHEYMSTKVSSIRSYFTQIDLYMEWIKKKMASPGYCGGGAYAKRDGKRSRLSY